MKKAITFVTSSIIIGILLVLALFLSIVATPKDIYSDTYENTLSTKYENLLSTKSPKIIVITGSSAAFSLDGDLLAKETGMNVVNMALHAGMGALYETELSKANIGEGDIVLLGYEWGWVTQDDYMDTLGTDLIMRGIDENVEMYKYLPVRKYKDVLGYLFTFANEKRTYTGGASGVYSRSAFSENGNTMTIRHDGSPIISDYEAAPENYRSINFQDPVIPEATVEYLKNYKEYVESKGASVYWIGCPTYEAGIHCDYTELQKAANQVEVQIGIDFISNPIDYVFPGEYMYDKLYHTNTLGMEYRTELLAEDLKNAGIIEDVNHGVVEAGEIYEFEYSGVPAGFLALEDGTYKIEAWGAGAASSDSMHPDSTGKGAYVSGTVELKKGDILYIYVGGQSGWNGGGKGEAGGGDATDVRLVVGDVLDFDSLKSRIMVAGGGGVTSFVSGYEGCDAMAEESTEGNIIYTGQPNHYSGIVFKNIMMIDGSSEMPTTTGEGTMIGNTGNGKAVITYLGN